MVQTPVLPHGEKALGGRQPESTIRTRCLVTDLRRIMS